MRFRRREEELNDDPFSRSRGKKRVDVCVRLHPNTLVYSCILECVPDISSQLLTNAASTAQCLRIYHWKLMPFIFIWHNDTTAQCGNGFFTSMETSECEWKWRDKIFNKAAAAVQLKPRQRTDAGDAEVLRTNRFTRSLFVYIFQLFNWIRFFVVVVVYLRHANFRD